MTATREEVLEALKGVTDPISGQDLVSAGPVRALTVDGGYYRRRYGGSHGGERRRGGLVDHCGGPGPSRRGLGRSGSRSGRLIDLDEQNSRLTKARKGVTGRRTSQIRKVEETRNEMA